MWKTGKDINFIPKKNFFLTYCQSFLLISYSLHNPPRRSRHSSWQADEITVSNRQQRQSDVNFKHLNFLFKLLNRRGETKLRWTQPLVGFLFLFFYPTCFCLVTRSQSSTSQGLSSSGIFTFTSTRLANISSWTQLKQLGSQIKGIMGLHRSKRIINNHLFAPVAHMNWKLELGGGVVSPVGRTSVQLQARWRRAQSPQACSEPGLWPVRMFLYVLHLLHSQKLQRCWTLMLEMRQVRVHRRAGLFTTHTLSTVGSTRALFFLGPCGVSPLLVPSPGPGAEGDIHPG